MKHLRKFNESQTEEQWFLELYEFCQLHLAYLLDDGFVVFPQPYEYNKLNKAAFVWFQLENNGRQIPFKWNDVKDHFIPFVIMLDRKYNLYEDHPQLDPGKSIVVSSIYTNGLELNLEELEELQLEKDDLIKSIAIVIQRPSV